MQDVIASVVSTKKKSQLKILVAVAITILSISMVGRNATATPRGSARTEGRSMAKKHVPLIDCFGCEYYRELQVFCIAHRKRCLDIERCRWNELNAYRRLSIEEIRKQYGGQDDV